MPKVVLYQPEIPQNTGNIGRLCVATRTPLYLVAPLGFKITDKEIRRSGLDYWPNLNYEVMDDLALLCARFVQNRFWFFTTKARRSCFDVRFDRDDFLVFGPESRGLPQNLLEQNAEHAVCIPMQGPTRSLNLSTAVGIAVYELLRQTKSL